MTDITPEAVELDCGYLRAGLMGKRDQPDAARRMQALQARVTELEENINLKADFIEASISDAAAQDYRIAELETALQLDRLDAYASINPANYRANETDKERGDFYAKTLSEIADREPSPSILEKTFSIYTDRIEELEAASIAPVDDEFDGVLFRFWIRAASYPDGWPSDFAKAICHCNTPDKYRAALIKLAHEKGVNLPHPQDQDGE